MKSQTHIKNADSIDLLEDGKKITQNLAIILHWINNLEEIAGQIVVHNTNNEAEELRFAFVMSGTEENRTFQGAVVSEHQKHERLPQTTAFKPWWYIVFLISRNYADTIMKYYAKKEKKKVEFAISRYNAILRQSVVNEQYLLGEQR